MKQLSQNNMQINYEHHNDPPNDDDWVEDLEINANKNLLSDLFFSNPVFNSTTNNDLKNKNLNFLEDVMNELHNNKKI